MIFRTEPQENEDNPSLGPYPLFDPGYGYQHGPSPAPDTDQSQGYGIEQLLGNRRELLDSRISMLVGEISQRYRIREHNLYHINLDQCGFRSLIFERSEGVWDKTRTEFERKIIDLEQEKRREYTGFFNDILLLTKELREALVEKHEEQQKESLLVNQSEEIPWKPYEKPMYKSSPRTPWASP
jgi:hypothetical protein